MNRFEAVRKACSTAALAVLLFGSPGASAVDLGVEGQVYLPIEEDLRIAMMRLVARQDMSEHLKDLEDSARNYTKNLPAYYRPLAEKTETLWKDVGILVTEDIYLPVPKDWVHGSVFDTQQTLVAPAGTYLNPIADLPSTAIERFFIFDATDPDQMALARVLMTQDIPQLKFVTIAGDPGQIAEEMHRPVYFPPPTMLEKLHVNAVPALLGFGKGMHQGHLAVTTFKLPTTPHEVQSAWFGLPHAGYSPEIIPDTASGDGSLFKAMVNAVRTNGEQP